MVNMNLHEDPCVYGLTYDGRVFYVGYTSKNALNRWWQHRARANSGHQSPVYKYMRSVGVQNVSWEIIERVPPGSDHAAIEALHIARLLASGVELVNEVGRDGKPYSVSEEMRARMGGNKGRPTWIKGKTGEDAGWTDERRAKMAERAAERRANREPRHGTNGEYVRYGCRCEDCTEARRIEVKRVSDSEKNKRKYQNAGNRIGKTPKKEIHGEVACYKIGKCRCELCATAYREYKRSISKTPEEKRRPHQYKGAGRIERQTNSQKET